MVHRHCKDSLTIQGARGAQFISARRQPSAIHRFAEPDRFVQDEKIALRSAERWTEWLPRAEAQIARVQLVVPAGAQVLVDGLPAMAVQAGGRALPMNARTTDTSLAAHTAR